MFGVTRKKGGWDCMRHIEIMASGCVPFFVDIDELPRRTMQFYPKKLLKEARIFPGTMFNGANDDPSSFAVDGDVFDFEKYYELATKILEHSRRHLTTKAMARYVLQLVGVPSPKRVLIATSCVGDYLQDTMLHGLRRVLGDRLVDYVPEQGREPELCVADKSNSSNPFPNYRVNTYMDSWAASSITNFDTRKRYGNGFTVWNRLSKTVDGDIDRSHVYDDIEAGVFDLIFITDRVLTLSLRQTFVEHVRTHTDRSKVVALIGTDEPVSIGILSNFHRISAWIFERELP